MQFTTEWHRGLAVYLKLGCNPHLIQRARELWSEALGLCRVQHWRQALDRRRFEDHFAPYSHASLALQSLLDGCDQVVLLAVSIGDGLERRVRRYMDQRQPLEGYLLDRMGSFLAETAMRQLDRALQRENRSGGCQTTRRFSPGYHDFNLKAQIPFVALIDTPGPDLRVTEAGQLLPEKSITAVKGVLPPRSPNATHARLE